MTEFPTMDPELAAVLGMLPEVDFADPAAARIVFDELMAAHAADISLEGVELRELAAPGQGGAPDVPIRFFTPEQARGPLPVLVWMHGGGFAIGTAASSDEFCVSVVRELGFAVANVEYRLAPETPFPGPLDDCYAALRHVHAQAGRLGIDAGRIAVGGQSAGGGLAAATVLRARDEGVVPIAFQLLEIPELDDRLATPSMIEFVDTPVWHRPNAIHSWRHYLGDSYAGPEDPDVSPYAAPARATDLTGLPATYVSTMELDPLRDEGIDYAVRLLRAGSSVELHSFPGTFHGSSLVATAEVSRRAHAEALDALRRGLRSGARAS
ncbi:alpha/beta hydrolase [Tsukamurella sp. 8F]|uniref:alpha/beta hydrolase n=1 Tax=unclassified Tsukamurella TaxID=2633480 RepID=UPI0023B98733|nr:MULTISPECIES: alpha/beta hydrolase [unclassified Tsukamurella]MDF0531779.1 alpha/beta hydrolase [Tsukamurella sp. 8J]MDF0588019.1 alpha/beta hydrolase [Tsukamurella sp. 8F]